MQCTFITYIVGDFLCHSVCVYVYTHSVYSVCVCIYMYIYNHIPNLSSFSVSPLPDYCSGSLAALFPLPLPIHPQSLHPAAIAILLKRPCVVQPLLSSLTLPHHPCSSCAPGTLPHLLGAFALAPYPVWIALSPNVHVWLPHFVTTFAQISFFQCGPPWPPCLKLQLDFPSLFYLFPLLGTYLLLTCWIIYVLTSVLSPVSLYNLGWFTGMPSLQSLKARTQKGPGFGFMLCSHYIEIIVIFQQGTLPFQFVLGPTNYIADIPYLQGKFHKGRDLCPELWWIPNPWNKVTFLVVAHSRHSGNRSILPGLS